MLNIVWIRTKLFGISQKAMADICATTQASLSRVEKGEAELRLSQLHAIRSTGKERFGDLWNDRFFFDPVDQLAVPTKPTE